MVLVQQIKTQLKYRYSEYNVKMGIGLIMTRDRHVQTVGFESVTIWPLYKKLYQNFRFDDVF